MTHDTKTPLINVVQEYECNKIKTSNSQMHWTLVLHTSILVDFLSPFSLFTFFVSIDSTIFGLRLATLLIHITERIIKRSTKKEKVVYTTCTSWLTWLLVERTSERESDVRDPAYAHMRTTIRHFWLHPNPERANLILVINFWEHPTSTISLPCADAACVCVWCAPPIKPVN